MKDEYGHDLGKKAHWSACMEGRNVKVAFCWTCGVVEVRGSWPVYKTMTRPPPSEPDFGGMQGLGQPVEDLPKDELEESFVGSSRQ